MKSLAILIAGVLLITGCVQASQTGGNQNVVNNTGLNESANNTGATTYTVTLSNYAFNPSELSVKAGDLVTWVNDDSVSHTIVSDSGSEIESPVLSNGQEYSHTFSQAGTYNYHCSIHPIMKGTVTVSE